MRYFWFAATLAIGAAAVMAQPLSSDERQIRELIAADDAGQDIPRIRERIYWLESYKRPIVDEQRPDEIPDERASINRIPESAKRQTRIRRIEVSKSGDLAYEFNDGEQSYQLTNGKRVWYMRSALRVWKKEDGQWKVAAYFVRPHYGDW